MGSSGLQEVLQVQMDSNSMSRYNSKRFKKVAFIGNYLPRKCGIATFTTDLADALSKEYPDLETMALAMNDTKEGYDYPERVRFQLDQSDLHSYQSAADFLNLNRIDIVSLQHEYGIFGGEAGEHLLTLLRNLEMPVVTTLHTVLQKPNPDQYRVMQEVVRLSDQVVVMSERGVEYLQKVYGVPPEKINLVPHGIPDVPFVDPNFFKDKFGVEGRPVLLTFGLLSSNKGIENVIRALPFIKEKYPNIAYLCVGATHPHVIRHEGEKYRESLVKMALDLGVEDSIIWINRFVDLGELVELIGAADIYITPYNNRDQITSGTLAYTLGAGKAIVSTPYWYAEELLADGRGKLVPFRDPEAIAREVNGLLANEMERHAIRKRAYMHGRTMIWPEVARRYSEIFEAVITERFVNPRLAVQSEQIALVSGDLPEIKLDHLLRMTDNTGMLQHANYHLPNYHEGYCTDDNSRALIAAMYIQRFGAELLVDSDALASRYLAFLHYALNEDGYFRNFLSFDRRWQEQVGSEDSHGRALWGLGTAVGMSSNDGVRNLSVQLFNNALPAVYDFSYIRSSAFALLGIAEYHHRFEGDRAVMRAGEFLSNRLVELYQGNSSADWQWFENELTYSNAAVSHALLATGQWLGREDMIEIGLRSLRWLLDFQTSSQGHFSFIGSCGFYPRGGPKACFDQQPIEAGTTVSACLEAYRITRDKKWLADAHRAFAWFLGKNDLGLPLYDEETGGCRDGLGPNQLNPNEGAESLLAFLQSQMELYLIEQNIPTPMLKHPERLPMMKQRTFSKS